MNLKKKVVLYGIGRNFEIFIKFADLSNIDIVALADRSKHGSYWNEQRIYHPEELKQIDFDELYLLIKEKSAAFDYLVNEIGISSAQIRSIEELNLMYMLNDDLTDYRYVMLTDHQDYLNYPYNDLTVRTDFLMRGVLLQAEKLVFGGAPCKKVIYFIFRDHCYQQFKESGLFQYIRKKYPESKSVLIMSDMCDGDYGRLQVFGSDYVDDIKATFDLILTYHSGDADKYGLQHYTQAYPSHPSNETPIYDVFFVGKAKNRLNTLHQILMHLKSNGVSCRFWISEVENDCQLDDPDITYNKRLSYSDYLKEVGKCRCILEICQEGDESTYRYAEAVINNKKLIVNDPSCKNRKYFSNEFMQCIDQPQDIDCAWLPRKNTVDYKYENDFSPENLLRFLEEQFKVNE